MNHWEIVGYGSPQENFSWVNPEAGREVVLVNKMGQQWRGTITSVTEEHLTLKMPTGEFTFVREELEVFKVKRFTVRKELPCVTYI